MTSVKADQILDLADQECVCISEEMLMPAVEPIGSTLALKWQIVPSLTLILREVFMQVACCRGVISSRVGVQTNSVTKITMLSFEADRISCC